MECGSPLVIRKGKYGQFTACSNYPTCKYIKKENKQTEKEIICKCPKCEGNIIVRKTKKGKEFYGCDNFPKCKYIKQEESAQEEVCDCPNCSGKIVKKRSKRGKIFYGCSNYPKCKTVPKRLAHTPLNNSDQNNKHQNFLSNIQFSHWEHSKAKFLILFASLSEI